MGKKNKTEPKGGGWGGLRLPFSQKSREAKQPISPKANVKAEFGVEYLSHVRLGSAVRM